MCEPLNIKMWKNYTNDLAALINVYAYNTHSDTCYVSKEYRLYI